MKDYHAERCIGLWNASTDLIDDVTGRARPTGKPLSTRERERERERENHAPRQLSILCPLAADTIHPKVRARERGKLMTTTRHKLFATWKNQVGLRRSLELRSRNEVTYPPTRPIV